MTLDELKQLMCIPADAKKEYIKNTFEIIADFFKNGCVIKYDNVEYRIVDFEFYFYNKNHQDITVHPRRSKALCWYINEFGGIDLNFESNIDKVFVKKGKTWSFKYKLTNDSYYGGILIRKIQRTCDDRIFDGPLKVAELFRIFDANSHQQNNPVLVEVTQLAKSDFKKGKRHNLLGNHKGADEERIKAKVGYNLKEWFTDDSVFDRDKLEKELKEEFISKEYHIYSK